jgi:hypothetical protein
MTPYTKARAVPKPAKNAEKDAEPDAALDES